MKIYVAGPYTQGDVAVNVRNAILTADALADLGHTPFVPHLTHYWHTVKPRDYEFWMAQDLQWLETCDALFRIPGLSRGADMEVSFARSRKLPIWRHISEVPK